MTAQDLAQAAAAQREGTGPPARHRFRIGPGCCVSCAADLTAVRRLPGVSEVQVFDAAGLVVVTGRAGLPAGQVVAAAASSGVTLEPAAPGPGAGAAGVAWWRHGELLALAAAVVLLLAGLVLVHAGVSEQAGRALEWATIVIGGGYPLRRAAQVVRQRRVTIGVLLVAAAAGALALGRVEEAAELVVVFSLGEVLEGYAADRARASIRALMALAPPEATRLAPDGGSELVPVEVLVPGDVVLVRPGERLPTDGRVTDGQSWIDQSPVTGESMPAEAGPGCEVFGGTVNGAGALRLRVSRPYADTVLARVIRQVEEAQARRGRAQRFADRFGAAYTPVMFGVAAAVALSGSLLGLGWAVAVYRGLVVLSVSCSCALVISVPVAVVAAIARAARDGILIKGGACLEQLGAVEAIAFDKTGTLTQGRPAVTQVIACADDLSAEEILQLGAAVEQASEHPIGRAIVTAATQQGLHLPAATSVTALAGRGITAIVGQRRLLAGRATAAQRADPQVAAAAAGIEDAGATAITLTDCPDARDVDGGNGSAQVLGVLGVADQIRPDAGGVVMELRRLGIHRQVMLTGDNPHVAAAIAARVGLDGYQADLLPEDKTAAVAELKTRHRVVGMVGDGVNDAPALATAHVAIAMGAAGTDVALETADIALMADDLTRLPAAVRVARRARANITQNIALSLGSVALLVTAALAGLLSLTEGVVLNEGTALLIIANGLRMLRRARTEESAR